MSVKHPVHRNQSPEHSHKLKLCTFITILCKLLFNNLNDCVLFIQVNPTRRTK